ncbi:hypothetical protein [Kibdelosporangium philippinense]|uniref:hypothetical protein n=1 Tax=Kibdelosporangium philippinense TaxID=211113 RepID=UPI00361732C7
MPEVRARVEAIQSMVDSGVCLRCGDCLPEWPDISHTIGDACLPICTPCGNNEALEQVHNGGFVGPVAEWPTLPAPPRRSRLRL